VSVARALAPVPRILVADEPTSSIDQSARAQLLNVLRKIRLENKLAIVFISHDLGLVRYLTSRTYVMRAGRIVDSGETEMLFSAPEHPYTVQLVEAIPGSRTSGLSSVPGEC
jgi:ABC-type dipeptide/oligopeptide/nickel transport system ATPase component